MRWLVPLLLLLVAACAERWERPGATEAESEAAQARCAAEAWELVPQALVWTQTAPGFWQPPRRFCQRKGEHVACFWQPGFFVPPRFGWVDFNTGRRRAMRDACLAADGWRYAGLRLLRLW